MRFERFLADFVALLDRFVAMVVASFDLVWTCSLNLPDPCCCPLLYISESEGKRRRGFCVPIWLPLEVRRFFPQWRPESRGLRVLQAAIPRAPAAAVRDTSGAAGRKPESVRRNYLAAPVGHGPGWHAADKARTDSRRLTLGMRFDRFLLDLLALLDRFVAIFISSFDLELLRSTCLALCG